MEKGADDTAMRGPADQLSDSAHEREEDSGLVQKFLSIVISDLITYCDQTLSVAFHSLSKRLCIVSSEAIGGWSITNIHAMSPVIFASL